MLKESQTSSVPSVAEQAEAWFVSHMDGPLTKDQQAQFDQWCQEAVHREAYEEVRLRMEIVDQLGEELLAETFESELRDVSEASKPGVRVGFLGAGVAAAIAMAVGVTLSFMAPKTATMIAYEAPIGSTATIELADSSVITLNTGTRTEVSYTDEERLVSIDQGEAFFNVARDVDRPFRIETRGGVVEVLGTSFNLRSRDGETTVAVVSGAVNVNAGGENSLTLLAGQAASFSSGWLQPVAHDFDATKVLSWRRGRLVFEDVQLTEVLSEINLYTKEKVYLAPGTDGATTITASFDTSDIEDVTEAIALTAGLSVSRRSGHVVLHENSP